VGTEGSTVGVVVVTHGQLATELLNAAEMIVGDLPRFTAVSIGWHDDVEVAREAIQRAVAKVDTGGGVLLLTDMFGGTPSNLGLTFLDAGRIEVVTGVNLPMLIKLAKAPDEADVTALARVLCEHGRAAIRVASDLLRAEREPSAPEA
jgi:mannose PTS system EIIA component